MHPPKACAWDNVFAALVAGPAGLQGRRTLPQRPPVLPLEHRPMHARALSQCTWPPCSTDASAQTAWRHPSSPRRPRSNNLLY